MIDSAAVTVTGYFSSVTVTSPVNQELKTKSLKWLSTVLGGNDSNLLIVFYVQIMPDDFVMQLHRF